MRNNNSSGGNSFGARSSYEFGAALRLGDGARIDGWRASHHTRTQIGVRDTMRGVSDVFLRRVGHFPLPPDIIFFEPVTADSSVPATAPVNVASKPEIC